MVKSKSLSISEYGNRQKPNNLVKSKSLSNVKYDDRGDQPTKEELQKLFNHKLAAGIAGGTVGLLLVGPLVAAIAGFGTVYYTNKKGVKGDVARAMGDVAFAARDRGYEVDEKHHIVDVTKKAANQVIDESRKAVNQVVDESKKAATQIVDGSKKVANQMVHKSTKVSNHLVDDGKKGSFKAGEITGLSKRKHRQQPLAAALSTTKQDESEAMQSLSVHQEDGKIHRHEQQGKQKKKEIGQKEFNQENEKIAQQEESSQEIEEIKQQKASNQRNGEIKQETPESNQGSEDIKQQEESNQKNGEVKQMDKHGQNNGETMQQERSEQKNEDMKQQEESNKWNEEIEQRKEPKQQKKSNNGNEETRQQQETELEDEKEDRRQEDSQRMGPETEHQEEASKQQKDDVRQEKLETPQREGETSRQEVENHPQEELTKEEKTREQRPSQQCEGVIQLIDETQSARAIGAGVVGGMLGLCVVGPIVAVLSGFMGLYLAETKGAAGDIARAIGDVAVTTREKAREVNSKHRVTDTSTKTVNVAWRRSKRLSRGLLKSASSYFRNISEKNVFRSG